MKKSDVHYHLRIGPGGRKCACCFPAPGKRKEEYRRAKKKAKRLALQIEFQELNNNNE